MAKIKKTVLKEKNLTVFSAHGNFIFDQLIDEIDRVYSADFTLHALWDFTGSDFSAIKGNQVEKVIEHTRKYVNLRKGGKSAFIVSSEFGYGLGRMFDILTDLTNSPVEYRIFKDIDEAIHWIET